MKSDGHPNIDLIALGVRQPWAELILRGVKTVEVRSQATNVRGPIYLYASKKFSTHTAAAVAAENYRIELDGLPRGVLVGTVEIIDSTPCRPDDVLASCVSTADLRNRIGWRLENPIRFNEPMPVRYLPYGVWFYPFRRRSRLKRRR